MKNQRGVTLLELIVVMVIIALGAILVVPQIGAWTPRYRLNGAVREMVSTLRVAQVQAVARNTAYRVQFSPDTGAYVLQRDAGGGNWVDEKPVSLPQGIQMQAITWTGNSVPFYTNSSSSSGSLKLINSKGTVKTITVTSATGRIRID